MYIMSYSCHVIGVCHSASETHNQQSSHHVIGFSDLIDLCVIKIKSPQTFAHIVNFSKTLLPCLIIMQSCYFDCRINKPFACSRCVISAFRALLTWSQRITRAKAFYLNYPLINEVGKSDHVVWRQQMFSPSHDSLASACISRWESGLSCTAFRTRSRSSSFEQTSSLKKQDLTSSHIWFHTVSWHVRMLTGRFCKREKHVLY